jgi:glycosyltransferase involved in cell wall biosynthesis
MTAGPVPESHRPESSARGLAARTKRICLVTSELAGPDYNGGIGTAVRGLAQTLVRNAYDVEILYTRVERWEPHCFRGSFEDQVNAYQRNGIRLRCLAHDGKWNDWLAKSYQVMTHLAAHRYDHVFFNDMHGEGYYSILERQTGSPHFAGTTMAVVLHSATQWIAELNQQGVNSIDDIRLIEMERRCIELADAVISPSAYMLTKYKGYGWKIPDNSRIIPNLLPFESRREDQEINTCRTDEIVFFGRLERRKGLWLFCDAIDRVKHEIGDVKITFLGKLTTEEGELTGYPLLKRAAAWPFEIDILHDFDREQALNYLRAGRRMAIMPALEDNSPCAILECLYEGIPFAASSGSGGQELIAQESREQTLFEPTVGGLTERLRSILREGAVTARSATHPNQNEKAILSWLSQTLLDHQVRQGQVGGFPSSASQAKRTPFHHLVILVGPRGALDHRSDDLEQAVALHPVGTPVTVLTDMSDASASQYSARLDRRWVTIVDVRRFQEFLTSLAQDSAAVAFSHVTQPVTPAWLDRAEACYRQGDISALTGLAAVTARPSQDLPHYFSSHDRNGRVVDFRIGNAPLLFPLAPDTNSGFISIRADVLAKISSISPFDHQYSRFKRTQEWVHEVVVRLVEQRERFEVLPDPVLNNTLAEEPSPVSWHERTARSLVGSQLDYVPGSEQALLARLAIETNLGAAKKRTAADRLAHLSATLGRRLDDLAFYASDEQTARTLASMAKASGQVELAHELMTAQLLSRRDGVQEPRPLASFVRRRATEIRLFDLAAEGAFTAINLTHEWSFKTIGADREIEIHPNTYFEGRATVTFRDMDLTEVSILKGAVRLASGFSRPVRFRVDIASADGTSHFGLERVIRANETTQLEEELPAKLLTRCDISLSTEMASPLDQTEGAWARWVDLRLTGA